MIEEEIVLIGVGQAVVRDGAPGVAANPVEMMADAARAAAEDALAGEAALARVDTVATVDAFGWHAASPPALLAEALACKPRRRIASTVGGNTPQAYVTYLAEEIRRDRARLCLIAGVNVVASMARARAAGSKPDWPKGGEGEVERFGDEKAGSTDYENAHGLFLPATTYPLFENALRARRGVSPQEHSRRLGALLERFTRVAAANPYAWFPTPRSAEEIATASAANRLVAYPYTKFMNAVMAVDQAAAVLLTSAAEARRLGVPEDRWVWFLGGGEASEDPWYVSERPRLDACPSMSFAARQAMARAGVAIDDLDLFDLYSCFPVAVELACEGIGLAEDDPRGLTVTGGLPYFGGPGNNYSLHAIAAMAEKLRASAGSRGLVTANGWYLTKHAAGVYGSAPPVGTRHADPREEEARHREGPVPLSLAPEGPAFIETYTVLHGRDGEPETGIVVGRLASGPRFLAHTPPDPALLGDLLAGEAVGRRGTASAGDPTNLFVPD